MKIQHLFLLQLLSFRCVQQNLITLTDVYNPHFSSDVYLSIVIVGRNDRWGHSRFIDKIQLFINFTTSLACEVGRASAELVVVEWNPPENEPRITQALSWPR